MSMRPDGPAGSVTDPAPEVDTFDAWLRRSLAPRFDAVLAEPIPEDILRLIEEDRPERERIRRRRAWGRAG